MHIASCAHLTLDLPCLAQLLPPALPAFLLRQRWFGARSRTVQSARVIDVVPVPGPDAHAAHVLVEVACAGTLPTTWQLLVGLCEPGAVTDPSLAIAHFETPQGAACIYDILRSPQDCARVLLALKHHAGRCTQRDRLLVEWTPALDALAQPIDVRPVQAEQTNSSLVLGQHAVFKLFRRLDPGLNPDVEVTRALSTTGFDRVPRHFGSVQLERATGELFTLAALQQFVCNEGDGWCEAQRRARAFLDDPCQARLDAGARGARALGATVAALHRALASLQGPAWCPEPIETQHLERWRDAMLLRLARASGVLRQHGGACDQVDALARSLPAIPDPGRMIRIHGDLHLGQVLQTPGGWVVFDFEGEPDCPLADRSRKHSAVRDVAGMLRSWHYAAFSVLFSLQAPGHPEWLRLQSLALRWEGVMRDAFLAGWSQAVDPLLLPSKHSLSVLLDIWELDKAVYELAYEADHRPDWLPIPMHAIDRITSRKRV